MPLDIRSQVVTALDNINRNPELYTPPKPTIPLETRINDLKEANPSKYRDYISTLTSSANSGNEEARELLGKVGEDAARQRRGYEGLNKAIYIPAIIGAGALAAPSISASGKVVSWVYRQLLRWIRTGIDIGLTADGARNLFSKNGIQKTYREAKVGNYGKAALSGAVDILDLLGGYNLSKKIINKTKNLIKLFSFNNKYQNIYNDFPKLSQTSNRYIINVGPTKDYSESPSLFAKRLDSGGAKRVGYPEYALPELHSGIGPHMQIVKKYNDNLIGESLGTYVERYTPTQETRGRFAGVGHIEPSSMHPVLDNSSTPRYWFNSGVVDIIDYNGKKIVNKNIDRSYSKLTSEEKRDVLDHELHHTIDLVFRGPKRQYSPMGKFLDFSKLDKGPNPNYFGEHIFVNGSSWNEVAPRVTQIKNFLGITDGKTLMTPESLRQGFEKYIESGRFDNDISTLYNAVTNWEEFAKWVNASVPSIGAYVLVRGSDGKIHGEKVEKHNIY